MDSLFKNYSGDPKKLMAVVQVAIMIGRSDLLVGGSGRPDWLQQIAAWAGRATQMHPPLRITQFGCLPGHWLQMGLNAQINEPITIQVSPDLKQWHTLLSTNMPPFGVLSWTNSQAGAVSFFRACRGTP